MKLASSHDTISLEPSLRPGGYPPVADSREIDPIVDMADMTARTEDLLAFMERVDTYSFAILAKFHSGGCCLLVYEHLDKGSSEAEVRHRLEKHWQQLAGTRNFDITDLMRAWKSLIPHWQELRDRQATLEASKNEFFSRASL